MRSPVEGETVGSNPTCSAPCGNRAIDSTLCAATRSGCHDKITAAAQGARTFYTGALQGSSPWVATNLYVTGMDTGRVSTALYAGSSPVVESSFRVANIGSDVPGS